MDIKDNWQSGGMSSKMELTDKGVEFEVHQNVDAFLKNAERERYMASIGQKKDATMKKFCTVPDIVALEIDLKYGIDIHDEDTITNPAQMRKFREIIKRDYPKLLSY